MGIKKILVTGATGYIGSSLISHLLQRGYQPLALIREDDQKLPANVELVSGGIQNNKLLAAIIKDTDVIFHLAGIKGKEKCASEIEKVIETNICVTKNLINLIKFKPVKVIFASTYWVYGHKSPLPYNEDALIMPSEPYGWSKALAERIVMESGVNYNIVRLTNVFGYGKGIGYDEVTSLFLKRALAGRSISLKNNGDHCLDLTFIDDLCDALVSIMEVVKENEILNIGSGEPTSLSQLANVINNVSSKIVSRKATIIKEPREDDEIVFADRWVNVSRIKKYINFSPTDLEKSIEIFAKKILSGPEYAKKS